MCLPTLATCGLVVRKSRIQAHSGVFRPSLISYGLESITKVNAQYSNIYRSDCRVEGQWLIDIQACCRGRLGHRDKTGPLEAGWDHILVVKAQVFSTHTYMLSEPAPFLHLSSRFARPRRVCLSLFTSATVSLQCCC